MLQAAAMQRARQMYAGQPPGSIGSNSAAAQGQPALTPAQQLAEDRRKADEESLRASTVIAIPENAPVAAERTPAATTPTAAPVSSTTPISSATPAAVAAVEDKNRKDCVDLMDGTVQKYALCE